MPQELHVLRCFSCQTFQVHIVKKVPKWQCKMCGEKQSVKKVHFEGSGKDCRAAVQKLNTTVLAERDERGVQMAANVLTIDGFGSDDDENGYDFSRVEELLGQKWEEGERCRSDETEKQMPPTSQSSQSSQKRPALSTRKTNNLRDLSSGSNLSSSFRASGFNESPRDISGFYESARNASSGFNESARNSSDFNAFTKKSSDFNGGANNAGAKKGKSKWEAFLSPQPDEPSVKVDGAGADDKPIFEWKSNKKRKIKGETRDEVSDGFSLNRDKVADNISSKQKQAGFEKRKSNDFEKQKSIDFVKRKSNDFEKQKTNNFKLQKTNDFETQKLNDFEKRKTNDFKTQKTNEFEKRKTNDFETQKINDFEKQKSNNFKKQKSNDFETLKSNDFETQKFNDFERQKITNDFKKHNTNDFEIQKTNDFVKQKPFDSQMPIATYALNNAKLSDVNQSSIRQKFPVQQGSKWNVFLEPEEIPCKTVYKSPEKNGDNFAAEIEEKFKFESPSKMKQKFQRFELNGNKLEDDESDDRKICKSDFEIVSKNYEIERRRGEESEDNERRKLNEGNIRREEEINKGRKLNEGNIRRKEEGRKLNEGNKRREEEINEGRKLNEGNKRREAEINKERKLNEGNIRREAEIEITKKIEKREEEINEGRKLYEGNKRREEEINKGRKLNEGNIRREAEINKGRKLNEGNIRLEEEINEGQKLNEGNIRREAEINKGRKLNEGNIRREAEIEITKKIEKREEEINEGRKLYEGNKRREEEINKGRKLNEGNIRREAEINKGRKLNEGNIRLEEEINEGQKLNEGNIRREAEIEIAKKLEKREEEINEGRKLNEGNERREEEINKGRKLNEGNIRREEEIKRREEKNENRNEKNKIKRNNQSPKLVNEESGENKRQKTNDENAKRYVVNEETTNRVVKNNNQSRKSVNKERGENERLKINDENKKRCEVNESKNYDQTIIKCKNRSFKVLDMFKYKKRSANTMSESLDESLKSSNSKAEDKNMYLSIGKDESWNELFNSEPEEVKSSVGMDDFFFTDLKSSSAKIDDSFFTDLKSFTYTDRGNAVGDTNTEETVAAKSFSTEETVAAAKSFSTEETVTAKIKDEKEERKNFIKADDLFDIDFSINEANTAKLNNNNVSSDTSGVKNKKNTMNDFLDESFVESAKIMDAKSFEASEKIIKLQSKNVGKIEQSAINLVAENLSLDDFLDDSFLESAKVMDAKPLEVSERLIKSQISSETQKSSQTSSLEDFLDDSFLEIMNTAKMYGEEEDERKIIAANTETFNKGKIIGGEISKIGEINKKMIGEEITKNRNLALKNTKSAQVMAKINHFDETNYFEEEMNISGLDLESLTQGGSGGRSEEDSSVRRNCQTDVKASFIHSQQQQQPVENLLPNIEQSEVVHKRVIGTKMESCFDDELLEDDLNLDDF